MANDVKNVWRIKGIKSEKEINYILDKITAVYASHDDGGAEVNSRMIDFDLIIPEPRYKKDCPKDCIVNKDSHVAPAKGREWFDWYEWHLKYWGTKWNAYDGYTLVGKTYITLVFSTAWSFPDHVASMLANLGYDLDLRYADEDIGNNCGKVTYSIKDGMWITLTEKDLPIDPVKFANDLWNKY